jgi:glycosyltransferase involved in cell wall biosynthesis
VGSNTACIVTTYNRPDALARTLPQVVALGAPVIVVDDATQDVHALNDAIRASPGVGWLRLPANRGLACALNVGVAFWLADPAIEWISVFQDDVDVRQDCLAVLEQVAAEGKVRVLTGHHAAEHPGVAGTVGGVRVVLKQNSRATHMHGHRDYWWLVMPIPTRTLGAPKRTTDDPAVRGVGSNVDWWIYRDCPQSVVAQGGHVVCVPGLVRTFYSQAKDSTWNNAAPHGEEPPLENLRA